VTCYGEHVGEHIGNLGNILGTHWEFKGNIMGTHWNQGKMKKNPSPPSKKLKRKQHKAPERMLRPSHWLHEISLPKRIHHHFRPGLIPSTNNTLPI